MLNSILHYNKQNSHPSHISGLEVVCVCVCVCVCVHVCVCVCVHVCMKHKNSGEPKMVEEIKRGERNREL
jgi:hypothetical protein